MMKQKGLQLWQFNGKSPLLRIKGTELATSIAEYFRFKGKNVLLIMDSL